MAEFELSKLKKRRGMIKANMTRFKGFLDTYIQERDYNILKLRLEKAKSLLADFKNIHMEIEIAEDSNDDASRQLFEDNYYEQIARAQNLIKESERDAVSDNDATNDVNNDADIRVILRQLSNQNINEVKLPTITLPKFDGKYEDWLSFEESFKTLVHSNVKIQAVQKFNYLKSCLIGNAEQVIQSLPTTADNYEIAWNLLRERYSNKCIIIQNHVRALFELQVVSKESALGLSTLIDTALRHIHALQNLEQAVEGWDALLLHLIGSKVDKKTRIEWEKSLDGIEMPTIEQYFKFLRNRCHVLEAIPSETTRENTASSKTLNSSKVTHNKTKQVLFETQTKCKCCICGENHKVQNCEKFVAMNHNERSDSIKKADLCFNCFRANHRVNECKASSCRKCDRRHHTMLHATQSNNTSHSVEPEAKHDTEQSLTGTITQSLSSTLKNTSQIILSTALVKIADVTGQYQTCRVVLDSGSQSNFISHQCCDKLKLPKKAVDIPISGIGETLSHIRYSTQVTIKSKIDAFTLNLNCLIIPKVTELLPSGVIDRKILDLPKNITLADPTFDQPNHIDMLIGAEYFYQLLCIGQVKLKSGTIILQKTRFGWVVTGRIYSPGPMVENLCHLSRSNLEEAVQRFWEMEELLSRKILSPEEEDCEKHYQQTVERLSSGHYVVGLPFNTRKATLGESYRMALKRFQGLERRLITDAKLYEDYRGFLKEYEDLGHMTRIEDTGKQDGYFLPHHAVIKDTSTTTRLRVVFDASAKISTGVSLNDTLLTGPVVQQDLFSIVTRFRLHNIVFTTDIEKMFRQVFIREDDQQYQRIIWRNNPEEAIQIYKLNTVTYGMSSSPYLATRTVQQVAADERQNFPEAADLITRDMYVDDLVTGADTVERAQALKTQISCILRKGGFNVRKWASNHPHLNERNEQRSEGPICFEFSDVQKTLGILWNPQQDCLLYRITIQQVESKITKRTMLTQIASLYDPLGLLGPVIVKAKILLQVLWKLQLTWDEPVPTEVNNKWKFFQNKLEELNNITFPRQIRTTQSTSLQLHGFADASEVAYGACLYLRSSNADQSNSVVLVCSKSRVAPLKKQSLPKLELCAALLLAQLCQTISKALSMSFDKVVLWSDSTITSHWINTQPHRLKTFVANRVAGIQEINAQVEWRHIASQDNPADLVSRGLYPSELVDNLLWSRGPKWLTEHERNWPNFKPTLAEIPETRATINLKTEERFDILRQFSTITMLRRVVAWCLRFINNCRTKNKVRGSLFSFELKQTMNNIVKLVQLESFTSEIKRVESNRPLKNSRLTSLHPFLDSNRILRVGGRLSQAEMKYESKHQIILPERHHVTDLIIRGAHDTLLHAGPQATLYHIRQKYWPVHGKNRIKRIIHECIVCFKAKPKMVDYVMGNFPKERFNCMRPFANAGVDYCGPFWIKEKKHRNRTKVKVYVSSFVCLSSKAVHLELVSDLTTEAFIAALKRFFSRRGKSNLIMSDNATNFVGARNELRDLYHFINTQFHKETIIHWLSEQEVS